MITITHQEIDEKHKVHPFIREMLCDCSTKAPYTVHHEEDCALRRVSTIKCDLDGSNKSMLKEATIIVFDEADSMFNGHNSQLVKLLKVRPEGIGFEFKLDNEHNPIITDTERAQQVAFYNQLLDNGQGE